MSSHYYRLRVVKAFNAIGRDGAPAMPGALLGLAEKSCGDVPHVGFLQLEVLPITTGDAHIPKGFHNSFDAETHTHKSIDHVPVVASVPIPLSVNCVTSHIIRNPKILHVPHGVIRSGALDIAVGLLLPFADSKVEVFGSCPSELDGPLVGFSSVSFGVVLEHVGNFGVLRVVRVGAVEERA